MKPWPIGGRLWIGTAIIICLICSPAFAGGSTVSGKTVNNLLDESRYLFNGISQSGVTDPGWPDTEIRAWINDAVSDISTITECQEDSQRFTLSTGTSEYTMTASYMYVKDVVYQTGTTAFRTLMQGKLGDVGNIQQADEPKYWYELDGKIGIYPLKDTKDATISGDTIYVVFIPFTATLSGGSSIPTPAMFDQAILYFVAKRAFAKFGKAEQSAFYDQLYTRELAIRKGIYDRERSIWDVILPKNQQQAPQQ